MRCRWRLVSIQSPIMSVRLAALPLAILILLSAAAPVPHAQSKVPPAPAPKKNPLLKLAEPWPDAAALKARVSAIGREVGIGFLDAPLEVAPDTSLGQRAVLLYDGEPRQRAVAAPPKPPPFERGLDITSLDVVVDVAAHAAGDRADRVRTRLAAGEGETELAADLLEARLIGVSAAPTYVVAGRIAVQGAQEVEVLRALIAQGRRASG